MKTCPTCKAACFDDMAVCYNCMHDFSREAAAVLSVPVAAAHEEAPEEAVLPTSSPSSGCAMRPDEPPSTAAGAKGACADKPTHIVVPLVGMGQRRTALARPDASARFALEPPVGYRLVIGFEPA